MWKEIKEVWASQWAKAKDAWECAWEGAKASIGNAVYAIANFVWALVQTVIFLPLKTAVYETGKVLVKHLIAWLKNI